MLLRRCFLLTACLLVAVLGFLTGDPAFATDANEPAATDDGPSDVEEPTAQRITITSEDLVNPRMCMTDLSSIEGDIEFSHDLGEVFIGGEGISCTGSLFIGSGTELKIYRDLHVGQKVISLGAITVRGNLSVGDPAGELVRGSILVKHGDLKCYGDLHCAGFVHLSNGSLEAATLQTWSADASGAIATSGDCHAKGNLTGAFIVIEGDLMAGGDVLGTRRIGIDGMADVTGSLACGAGYLQIDGDIVCGNSISAGISIETAGIIDCQGTISSGTLAMTYRPLSYGSITCKELVSGEIIMGDLVETGDEPEMPRS